MGEAKRKQNAPGGIRSVSEGAPAGDAPPLVTRGETEGEGRRNRINLSLPEGVYQALDAVSVKLGMPLAQVALGCLMAGTPALAAQLDACTRMAREEATISEARSEAEDALIQLRALGANLEHLILLDFSKPELGLVTDQNGVARDALVYGFPKRFELDYLQGDEMEGFEGTCALTSVANLLTQSGKPTTEGEVVRRAANGAEWRKVA